jgi:Tfp pilus assembly protein PilO
VGWYVEGFVRQQSLRDTANFLLRIEGKHHDIKVFCQMGKDETVVGLSRILEFYEITIEESDHFCKNGLLHKKFVSLIGT